MVTIRTEICERIIKIPALLAIFAFVGSFSALAGDLQIDAKSTPSPPPVEKKEANPLCLLDGKICFDIQERLRWENRFNNYDFNTAVDSKTDDNWFLNRFRLGLAIKPVDWLTLYAQTQDSREFFTDRPTTPGVMGAEGNDNFDLRQAYFQLGPTWVYAKVGRQELAYGDERLIGTNPWNNFGRTFDAAKLHYEQSKFWVDVFSSTVVYILRDSFDYSDFFNGAGTHRDQVFSAIYGSTTAINPLTIDLYALILDEHNPTTIVQGITYPGTSLSTPGTRTDFVTLGTRLKADPKKLNGWEYEGEFAFQKGQVSDLNLTAFAAHAGGGYNFKCPWNPRFFAEYNYASGDHNPNDGNIQTFQNLFPSNHAYYGYMDLFSWQNMQNPELSLKVKPCKEIGLETDFNWFWLANTNDAWYRANGTTRVRPITPGAPNYVGAELDVLMTFQPVKPLVIWVGYSHFFSGSYVCATGACDDADFGYAQATINF